MEISKETQERIHKAARKLSKAQIMNPNIFKSKMYTSHYYKTTGMILDHVDCDLEEIVVPEYISFIESQAFAGLSPKLIAFTRPVCDLANAFKDIASTELKVVYPFNNITDALGMFNEANSLVTLDLSECDLSNVKQASFAFASTQKLKNLKLGPCAFQNADDAAVMFSHSGIEKLVFKDILGDQVRGFRSWNYCSCVKELDLRGLPPSAMDVCDIDTVLSWIAPSKLEILRLDRLPRLFARPSTLDAIAYNRHTCIKAASHSHSNGKTPFLREIHFEEKQSTKAIRIFVHTLTWPGDQVRVFNGSNDTKGKLYTNGKEPKGFLIHF